MITWKMKKPCFPVSVTISSWLIATKASKPQDWTKEMNKWKSLHKYQPDYNTTFKLHSNSPHQTINTEDMENQQVIIDHTLKMNQCKLNYNNAPTGPLHPQIWKSTAYICEIPYLIAKRRLCTLKLCNRKNHQHTADLLVYYRKNHQARSECPIFWVGN
jgi:hypothetical protein